ncbi:ParB/RepB/Spo0J family partition protein [Variovorax sp. RHLX14]|uniref:ParB/RepB/Spo0J family partition protein n=1 Tax=Variovorax sp. RHLX14 TaxID=1259731 RepID=UPI003F477BE9
MNRLTKRGSGIDFGVLDDINASTPSPLPQRPRSGVGAISASLTMGRGIQEENDKLKTRLAEFEGRAFVEKLDPKSVRPSVWANRHEDSFSSAEFLALKEEIANAGGNTQPIKVRPLKVDSDHRFEIVYGHRRHRACSELNLPVVAVVEELSDQQLFLDMERENRERQDLSPWEQGVHYRRALDSGLFPSARQLAIQTGASVGLVSGALALADLPAEVVAAFGSPLALQYRFASLLSQALAQDRSGLVSRAKKVTASGGVFTPKHVLHELLKLDVQAGDTTKLRSPDGKLIGSFNKDAKGALTIKLKSGVVSADAEARLVEFLNLLFKK